MKLGLTLGGKAYETELDALLHLSIAEAREIKRHCRSGDGERPMTIAEWRKGLLALDQEDSDTLAALAFVLRSRAGEQVDWAEIEGLSSQEFSAGFVMTKDEPPDEEPPDPQEDSSDTAA
jgi:hypothetical protein